jgi:hypothetical protein
MARVTGPLMSIEAFGMLAGRMIFTRTKTGFRCYENKPPKNSGTLERKAIYADGCAAWRLLDTEAKQAWRDQAIPLKITGFNLYMREYLITPTPSQPTSWDQAGQNWDQAGQNWDVV